MSVTCTSFTKLCMVKHASEALFNRVETHLIDDGFQKCPNDQTLFTKMNNEDKVLILRIFVYDLI